MQRCVSQPENLAHRRSLLPEGCTQTQRFPFSITQAQLSAHNGKDTKWSASADTSMRFTRVLHGISRRVLLNLFRVHKRNENRLRVPRWRTLCDFLGKRRLCNSQADGKIHADTKNRRNFNNKCGRQDLKR